MSKRLVTLIIVLAFVSLKTNADDIPLKTDSLPLWEVKFATFTGYGPSYPGSKESQFDFVPLPFPIYRGEILRIGDETGKPISARLLESSRFRLDLDFGMNFSVDSEDIDARSGMPDLDILLEAGPELEIKLSDSFAKGNLVLALQTRGAWSFDEFNSTSRGVIGSTELQYKKMLRDSGSEFKIRVTPSWANKDYMNFFYGVDEEYESSFRKPYSAKSGYLGTRISMSLKKPLSDKLEFRTGASIGLYNGAANDGSPLFTDKKTYSGYIALFWSFWESNRQAPRIQYKFE
ncbi:MAG: MipA/OmpV family protein [Pseudomonadota bacterium]|nr:MipA/OmpV family protein [Pseudomonadota bacterium]